MHRYSLDQIIGEGTFGTVYSGTRVDATASVLAPQQRVAIKRVRGRSNVWGDVMTNEVRALYAVRHKTNNVAQLIEVIREKDGSVFIVMSLESGSLHALLEKTRALPAVETCSVLRQLLQGLAALHGVGYMHRDVKPENILVTQKNSATSENEFQIRLADLGSASPIPCPGAEIVSDPYVTTRYYRAPEMMLGWRFYDSAVDIWAAGCVGYEVLTGDPLFPGEDAEQTLRRIAACIGSPPSSWDLVRRTHHSIPLIFPPRSLRRTFYETKRYPPTSEMPMHLAFCLDDLVQWIPERRPSALTALARHSFDA